MTIRVDAYQGHQYIYLSNWTSSIHFPPWLHIFFHVMTIFCGNVCRVKRRRRAGAFRYSTRTSLRRKRGYRSHPPLQFRPTARGSMASVSPQGDSYISRNQCAARMPGMRAITVVWKLQIPRGTPPVRSCLDFGFAIISCKSLELPLLRLLPYG